MVGDFLRLDSSPYAPMVLPIDLQAAVPAEGDFIELEGSYINGIFVATEFELEDDDDFERRFEDPAVVHIISHMAKSYIAMVDEWFDSNVNIFEEDHPEFKVAVAADSAKSPPDEDTITLIDSTEVIRWYQHQMYVKLQRALHSGWRTERMNICEARQARHFLI